MFSGFLGGVFNEKEDEYQPPSIMLVCGAPSVLTWFISITSFFEHGRTVFQLLNPPQAREAVTKRLELGLIGGVTCVVSAPGQGDPRKGVVQTRACRR